MVSPILPCKWQQQPISKEATLISFTQPSHLTIRKHPYLIYGAGTEHFVQWNESVGWKGKSSGSTAALFAFQTNRFSYVLLHRSRYTSRVSTSSRQLKFLHKVIKKSLCTWWLQYRKLQVMFKVPRCQGQGDTRLTLTDTRLTLTDTRLTLTPPVIPNSSYVIM
jgi:hypothetical protein